MFSATKILLLRSRLLAKGSDKCAQKVGEDGGTWDGQLVAISLLIVNSGAKGAGGLKVYGMPHDAPTTITSPIWGQWGIYWHFEMKNDPSTEVNI